MKTFGIFSFSFTHETWDDGIEKTYAFRIYADSPEKLHELQRMSSDEYCDFFNNLYNLEEQYGVHDFSTVGTEDDIFYQLFGYHSCEVDPSLQYELVEKHRNFFINSGYEVGDIEVCSGQEIDEFCQNSDNFSHPEWWLKTDELWKTN
ncbi:MAG: hypothetical protein WC284_17870 [Candidimonas sp.]